jgi:hypothetical protein
MSFGYQACKYYRRRFQIETFFSDQKSRGFHLHKSHLADPTRLSRLLLADCLAYLWMICQGMPVITEKKIGLIDRTDRIDKSLFLAWPGLDPLLTEIQAGFHSDFSLSIKFLDPKFTVANSYSNIGYFS